MDPIDPIPFTPGGADRTAVLLATRWMRAERLIHTYYPGEILALAETRGLPWGTEITGKWLRKDSALNGSLWPNLEEITKVSETLQMFTNSIEAIELGGNPDIVVKLVGGSMIDPLGLRVLLESVGKAFTASSIGQSVEAGSSSTSTNAWAIALDVSQKCKKRFLRYTRETDVLRDRGQKLAKFIEGETETLYFSDLVRKEMHEGFEQDDAIMTVVEGITLSQASVTGEPATSSYIYSIQLCRHGQPGVKGSILIDDSIGGRRLADFTPWTAVLSDGTVCNIASDLSWAVKWRTQITVLGDLRTIFLPMPDWQMETLKWCMKGRCWPSEIQNISVFNMSTLVSLGKISSAISEVMKEVEADLEDAYGTGCDEFSSQTESAACRALDMLRKQHPMGGEAFVSRNITTKTLLGLYEGCPTTSEFVSTMTERLVVGLSNANLQIKSDEGNNSLILQSNGNPRDRGISLKCGGEEPRVGISLMDMAKGLGVQDDDRRWMYAGLRMVARRFNEIAAGNYLAAFLNDAEYKRYEQLMPKLVNTTAGMLPFSDLHKHDRRTPGERKRAALQWEQSTEDEERNPEHTEAETVKDPDQTNQ